MSVSCPNCGRTNPEGASFCSFCATALPATSPSSPIDDLSRYLPAELLHKLAAARHGKTMAGERRTVTMLFADVQGSTAAAEKLDPEDWAEIINGAFKHLIRPVYRYEGTLARLMGDAILAFFGAPIAHEDDPERAVMAGLAMLRDARPYAHEVRGRWGVGFDLRVGINTGLVVVGEVGSDLRVEYSVLGDAVNVAARMEQTALPGTLQLTEHTQRLIERLFDFEELDPIAVKGKSEPVRAFRVVGVRDRPATTRGIQGMASPLVGRESELSALRRVIDEVRRGKAQICSIIGDAGVGKSRLLASLKSELSEAGFLAPSLGWPVIDAGRVRWAEARCISYDSSVPYAPFVDLFRRQFGLENDDPAEVAQAKVAASVAGMAPELADRIVPYLSALVDVDPGGEEGSVIASLPAPELQRRTFAAVVGYLEACSRAGPSVLVFEDLHWADPVSLALIEEVMRITDRTMLALVMLMRPYREDNSWKFHESAQRDYDHRYTSVRLGPLEESAARDLVEGLLDGTGIPEAIYEVILARADGNPFFVEEIVRSLVESGVLAKVDGTWTVVTEGAGIALSDSVTGLLTARLDRLSDDSKLAAQLASVLGREFDFGVLVALVKDRADIETAISDLLRRDLLEERMRIPTRVYAFRHALIQETAYASILLKHRRGLHAEIAEYLIDNEGAEPQQVAMHLLESRQETRAVPYLIEAGEQAVRAMSLADAIRFYDQALAWATDDVDLELTRRAHEGLGTAYTFIPDLTHASASYQRMLEFGKARGQPSVQITALNRLGFTSAFMGGDYQQATEYLEDARHLAEEYGDEMGLAEYHMNSCMIATSRGEMEKAAGHDAETARLGAAVGSDEVQASGLIQRTMSLTHGARYEDAMRALEQARRVTSSDKATLAHLALAEAYLLLQIGKLDQASKAARTSTELAVRVGSSWAAAAADNAGRVAATLGDYENALSFHALGLKLGEQSGQLFHSATAAAGMVGVYAELGVNGPETTDLRAKAVAYLNSPMGEMLASTVYAELGWAAFINRRYDEALDLFERGLAGSSASKVVELPSLLLGLASVRERAGDLAAASDLVSEAADLVEQRVMVLPRPLVAMVKGSMLVTEKRYGEAADVLTAGAAEAAAMGYARIEWRLRAAAAGALALDERVEESFRETAETRRLISALADRFVDASLRETFLHTSMATISALSGVATT